MKTMTCRQLGGACDKSFQAATFEEMVALSKAHGMEMFQKEDQAHLDAMQTAKAMMSEPGAMERYYKAKQKLFDALPDSD